MGRLYTRWINPNKRKFRRNSSTIPVTGFSKVETFDTEGQFYDFIDEYVTDDGITFYISVAEPEEGSDLEYAYLLPYIADFIDAEPNYNIMWDSEYKDYKSAIGMGNRKRQAKQKILDTILAKGLPAAFGAGKSQSIETQQIDESESQSTQIVSPDQIDPNETYEKWSWNDGWITKLRGSETGKSVLDKWNQLVKVNIANETNAAPFKGTKTAFFPKGVEPNADYIELEFYNKKFEPDGYQKSEQSISEPEGSDLASVGIGQKPSWLTVDSDAFTSFNVYRGTKEKLKDKGISSVSFSFGTQAKAYKLSNFALGKQITLLPILREYKFKGSEKIQGDSVLKSISKTQYLFLPIWTNQFEARKLELIKVYPPMTLDQAEKYFLDTYKRWTKKTRARKAKFEPAKSSVSNVFGLGLDHAQMTDFKFYLNQNDLVIDAVAATLNPDEIQQKASEKDKRFHRSLIRQLVKTGLYGTYVSLISGHQGSKLFYPESIQDGLFLDEIPLNEYTNVLAIVGEFDRLILDVIDFKYALIPSHSGVEFARFVRKRIKDFPDETKKKMTDSSFNNFINQELIEELARKGGQLVKQADESAEQADESTPVVTQKPVTASATQITNINQLLPDGDYRLWTYDPNFNSWGSGLSAKGSQFINKWDKIVEYNEQHVTKKAIFHFNDDPREAKVEYAQMEPNLVEDGEEIPVEKINWDTGKLKRIKRYSFDSYNPVYLYEGAEGQSFYITSVEWPQLGKFFYVVPPTENPIDYQFDYQTEGIMRAGTLKDLVKRIEKEGLSYKLYDPQAILHSDDFQYIENVDSDMEPEIVEEKMEVQTETPVRETYGSWSLNYDDCSITFERIQVK